MKIFTTRGKIKDVANNWHTTYFNQRKQDWEYGDDKEVIYHKLRQLDTHTCSEQDVINIIGNSSWTRIECHECGKLVEKAIELGQEPDYESYTATICINCLITALEKLNECN